MVDRAHTPATRQKRADLLRFVERCLVPYPAVQGVVGIGSIAAGTARPDSDIDAVVFFDPLDLYIVPAEFTWRESDDSFHSIFSDVEGVELDLARFDMAEWANPAFTWPEGYRAELAAGWVAFDRSERVAHLIAERTAYSDQLRYERLDDAITWLDQHLGGDGPQVRWESLGPIVAHDRLHAAYGYLVAALFAYNRHWRSWRNREMTSLLALPWLPDRFGDQLPVALNAPAFDHAGYIQRVEVLRSLFASLLSRLQADQLYGDDPIEEAFKRDHDEPGRAWNMDAWNAEHQRR